LGANLAPASWPDPLVVTTQTPPTYAPHGHAPPTRRTPDPHATLSHHARTQRTSSLPYLFTHTTTHHTPQHQRCSSLNTRATAPLPNTSTTGPSPTPAPPLPPNPKASRSGATRAAHRERGLHALGAASTSSAWAQGGAGAAWAHGGAAGATARGAPCVVVFELRSAPGFVKLGRHPRRPSLHAVADDRHPPRWPWWCLLLQCRDLVRGSDCFLLFLIGF
jgi:hypothetical protein